MSTSATTVLGGIGALLLVLKIYQLSRSRTGLPLPPGPKPEFLIGNLRHVPLRYNWIKFTEWGQEYGLLTYLKAAGMSFLNVNDQEVAIELLDKRSAIYSGRPYSVMASEFCGLGQTTSLLPLGPVHKEHRKLFSQVLQPNIIQRDYAPVSARLSLKLIKNLMDDPDNFLRHVLPLTGEILQTITYGDFSDGEVDLVDLCKENTDNTIRLLSGYAVDIIPALKYLPEWFPGGGFKREAKVYHAVAQEALWRPYNMVKKQAAKGEAKRSFTLNAIEAQQRGKTLDDFTIAIVASALFGAGSDTTASTLSTFMLAMTLYPEVQAKARAELDAVCGGQFPTHADKASTPYLDAVLLETLRWHPTVPGGVPHALAQDDAYRGYFIPKGTMIFVNVWGILHDERHFPDPMTFRPERWLSGTVPKTADGATIDPWNVVFGYGRRMCLGIEFSKSSLWIAMASILSSLEIRMKVDPQTQRPIVPPVAFTGEITSFPEHFPCDIKPRSVEWAERVREVVQEDERVHGSAH